MVIWQKDIEEILIKSEELMNTENLVRRDIRQGMDPQEAYKKYNAF